MVYNRMLGNRLIDSAVMDLAMHISRTSEAFFSPPDALCGALHTLLQNRIPSPVIDRLYMRYNVEPYVKVHSVSDVIIYINKSPPSYAQIRRLQSNSTVPAPTSPLKRAQYSPHPVLEDVRYISDRLRMRHQIPPAGRVAIVVEPGAEDEVGGYS